MSMTDPIADLLTRLRNAQQARHEAMTAPHSKLKENILRVIMRFGYVKNVEVVGEGVRKQLVTTLKYTDRKEPVISGIRRVSKPGRRVYRGTDQLGDLKPGLGAVILSTPKGVMTDQEAREAKVGGEILCQIW